MHHPPRHIFEATPDTLGAWCHEQGWAPFRAGQILEWVYQKGVIDPAQMTNLSRVERETLGQAWTFRSGRSIAHQRATDNTTKLLVEWDGESPSTALPLLAGDPTRQTECVMIPSEDPTGPRRTACISSQVGCPVGCRFCASGLSGLDGNLSTGRIVEQVWLLRDTLRRAVQRVHPLDGPSRPGDFPRITHVVFMGMGEPLSNFRPVLGAVRTLASLWGMGISARRITISTVGLPKAIERLAAELDLPVTLALSLHAPDDDIRRKLIPWAEYTTIAELLGACRTWFEKTGREITLEYTLLRGVNDHPDHAAKLAGLAKQLRANVNLIRYNEVRGLPFERPNTETVRDFQQVLRARGVNVHIRASRGRDIAAACGQLRHEHAPGTSP